MFDYYTLGTQARSAADAADTEPHLSPRQQPRELNVPTTKPPASSTTASGPRDTPLTPPQPIDNLAHELSKQTLFPDALHRPPAQRMPPGTSAAVIAELSAVSLEVDEDCEMNLSMDDAKDYQPVADWKRSRRQWYSRFANNPNNARTIQARLRDMISDKSQCNVRPAPTLSSTPSTVPTYPNLPKIEADDCHDSRLEVDEGFCEVEEDELSMMQRSLDADRERLMGSTGTLRRLGALRFRGSAETALRCQNVVKHRPRMRKRKGPGPTQDPKRT